VPESRGGGLRARGCLFGEAGSRTTIKDRKRRETMKKGFSIQLAIVVLFLCATAASALALPISQTKSATVSELRINLNTATATELAKLPGIGEKVAARILAYREENGRFQKVEEIMNVKGIGEKTFTRLRKNLYVEASKKDKAKKKN
jgi:competence protein ComEA